MNKEVRILIVVSVLSFLLLWALASHPYSYYQNLRNALFFGGIYLIYELKDQKKYLYPILMIVALFNPIIPFRFIRDIWNIFNITSAFLLITIAWQQGKVILR